MKESIPFIVCRHGDKIAEEGFSRAAFLDSTDRYHVHLTEDAEKRFQSIGLQLFDGYNPTVVDGYHTVAVRTEQSVGHIAGGAGLSTILRLHEEDLLAPRGFSLADFRTLKYLDGNIEEGIQKGDFDYATRMIVKNHFYPKSEDGYSFSKDISDTLFVFKNAINKSMQEYNDGESPAIILSAHNPSIEAFNIIATDCLTINRHSVFLNNNFKLMEMGDIFYGVINLQKDEIDIRRYSAGSSKKIMSLTELSEKIVLMNRYSERLQ